MTTEVLIGVLIAANVVSSIAAWRNGRLAASTGRALEATQQNVVPHTNVCT